MTTMAAPTLAQTLDPITVEVIENALGALIREMDATVVRTAMSTVIREVYDFGVSILDGHGRLVHGLWMSGELIPRTFGANIHDGDVFIFNDPYLSGGEMTHLGDTQLTVPVFWQGERVAFTSVWGHHMDVGGMSASGLPTTSREIFQEGIQIPPVKLFARGELNQAVMDIMARNSRTPDMMVGDTLAMVSACEVAKRRLEELFARYGAATILGCFDRFAARADQAMARFIERLPNLAYQFEDVLDNDGVEPGPVKLKLTMAKHDGKLIFDFTGSDPQVKGPINLILSQTQSKPRFWRRITTLLGDELGVDPTMSPNHGMFGRVQVIAPAGSIVNPRYPASVAARHVTSVRAFEMTQGILAQLYPDKVPAASQGTITTCMFRGNRRPTAGADSVAGPFVNMECVQGGSGGRPWGDGVDAVSPNKDLTIAPVEFLESAYPYLVISTKLRPNSGGAGKHRGGTGIERVYLVLSDDLLFCYLDERHQWAPWGLQGGQPGGPGSAWVARRTVEPSSPEAAGSPGGPAWLPSDFSAAPPSDVTWLRLPSKLDDFPLRRGDYVVVRTGGGAGWGAPWERDLELVRRDVLCRLVSPARAWRDYAAAIAADGAIDADRTAARRAELANRPAPNWINRGHRHNAPNPGEIRRGEMLPDDYDAD